MVSVHETARTPIPSTPNLPLGLSWGSEHHDGLMAGERLQPGVSRPLALCRGRPGGHTSRGDSGWPARRPAHSSLVRILREGGARVL